MDIQLKQRLIGAVVLILLAVIFIPDILDERLPAGSDEHVTKIEIKPDAPKTFSSEIIPLDGSKNKALIKEQAPVSSVKPLDRPSEPVPVAKKTEPPKTGLVSWTIQVAILSNEAGAAALVKKLKQKGFSAIYEKIYGSSGTRYRVRVEPVFDYEESKQLKQKIDRETGLNGLIVRYP
ncbi:MAG: SPOR domain-containing protein [Gammaproteobacteria bacterium]|nr:SPOR domain-containing protein [Gammaproteobacteria bacterium]